MTKTEQEVRDVLLGRTFVTDDGHLSSMGPNDYRIPVGISDSSVAVRLLGVAHRATTIESSLNNRQTLEAAAEAMKHIGRRLTLLEQPEAVCCLIRYVVTPPCVLTFTEIEETYVLTSWTGRAFLGFVSRLKAMRAFVKHLPSAVTVSEELPPQEERLETKKEMRSRLKKEKKEAKRAKNPVKISICPRSSAG